MNDDALDDLLRRSNPATTPLDEPLTVRQHAIMDRIVADPPRSRRHRAWQVALPAAAVVTALAVVVVWILNPFNAAPAMAWGPTPLSFVSSPMTLEEAIALTRERADSEGVQEPVRGSTITAWNLQVTDDGTPRRAAVIRPSVTEIVWAEDLSGRMVTSVGVPFSADGVDEQMPSDSTVEPGTVLDERTYGPGEFPILFPDATMFTPSQFKELLLTVAPDRELPGDAVGIVQTLLSEWTLTTAQHADLLDALTEYDSLRLLGTSIDRLGRDVIGIAAPASGDREVTLLISLDTGRIVGAEDTVLGQNDALGVPAGTVISYSLWEDRS